MQVPGPLEEQQPEEQQPALLLLSHFLSPPFSSICPFRKGQLFISSLSPNLGPQGLLWAASLLPQGKDRSYDPLIYLCKPWVRCIGDLLVSDKGLMVTPL